MHLSFPIGAAVAVVMNRVGSAIKRNPAGARNLSRGTAVAGLQSRRRWASARCSAISEELLAKHNLKSL